MGTVSGQYVATFAEADTAMLAGVSLNAPYPFFWLAVHRVEGNEVVCSAAGQVKRLRIVRKKGQRERASIVMPDPLFGPTSYGVVPFKQFGTPALSLLEGLTRG